MLVILPWRNAFFLHLGSLKQVFFCNVSKCLLKTRLKAKKRLQFESHVQSPKNIQKWWFQYSVLTKCLTPFFHSFALNVRHSGAEQIPYIIVGIIFLLPHTNITSVAKKFFFQLQSDCNIKDGGSLSSEFEIVTSRVPGIHKNPNFGLM